MCCRWRPPKRHKPNLVQLALTESRPFRKASMPMDRLRGRRKILTESVELLRHLALLTWLRRCLAGYIEESASLFLRSKMSLRLYSIRHHLPLRHLPLRHLPLRLTFQHQCRCLDASLVCFVRFRGLTHQQWSFTPWPLLVRCFVSDSFLVMIII